MSAPLGAAGALQITLQRCGSCTYSSRKPQSNGMAVFDHLRAGAYVLRLWERGHGAWLFLRLAPGRGLVLRASEDAASYEWNMERFPGQEWGMG